MTKTDWDWHAPKSVKRFFDFYLEDASIPENGSETRNGRTRNVAMIKMFQNVRGPVSSQRIVYACGKGDILGDGWFPREMTPVWETSAEIPCWWLVLLIASDWLKQIAHAARPIRSRTQFWDQYGISALVSQTSFCWETSGGVAKFRPFT